MYRYQLLPYKGNQAGAESTQITSCVDDSYMRKRASENCQKP